MAYVEDGRTDGVPMGAQDDADEAAEVVNV